MPQNPTLPELQMFFNNPIFGVFFMQCDQAVHWEKGGENEETLEYLMHHLRLTRINDTMLKQYGASIQDFVGRTPYEFFEHDPEQERILLRSIFNQGRHHAISYERDAAGAEVIIEGDYLAMYNEQGEITGLMGIQQDITRREQQQHAINQQNQKLLNIAWMQSHIVRAPLARLMSLTDLLSLQGGGDRELLDHLKDAADELDQVLRQIVAQSEQVRSHLKD